VAVDERSGRRLCSFPPNMLDSSWDSGVPDLLLRHRNNNLRGLRQRATQLL
jgi:hypothetical protein